MGGIIKMEQLITEEDKKTYLDIQRMKANKRVFSIGNCVEDETGNIYIIKEINLKGILLDNNVNVFYDIDENINFLKLVA